MNVVLELIYTHKTFYSLRSYPNNLCLLHIAVVLDGCIVIFLKLLMQSTNNTHQNQQPGDFVVSKIWQKICSCAKSSNTDCKIIVDILHVEVVNPTSVMQVWIRGITIG